VRKKVQELTVDLGVARIIEGKLGGLGGGWNHRRTELARRGSEGSGGVPATRVQECGGELVRELRRGDVMLMVHLVREEKGWNFGSTRNRSGDGG
jgi:hypothetical protein